MAGSQSHNFRGGDEDDGRFFFQTYLFYAAGTVDSRVDDGALEPVVVHPAARVLVTERQQDLQKTAS